ncbi:MAG: hypothetical protein K9N07_06245 [Candidatus Cloacimonetes bacterium]|nr:hypothetical protein [Candidatus Cloacimonadota bacterium]
MSIPLNQKEKVFMRKMLRWDQKKASMEVVFNTIFLVAGMLVTLYIAYKTVINLNNLNALWILLPGYVIAILLLSIFLVGDIRIKERRKYASVMRKILLYSRREKKVVK